jgi:hypothetical protein
MDGILVTIVEYINFCFLLAFTEPSDGRFGKGAACGNLNAVGVGMCFARRNTVLSLNIFNFFFPTFLTLTIVNVLFSMNLDWLINCRPIKRLYDSQSMSANMKMK